jgi:hypothetical protein
MEQDNDNDREPCERSEEEGKEERNSVEEL